MKHGIDNVIITDSRLAGPTILEFKFSFDSIVWDEMINMVLYIQTVREKLPDASINVKVVAGMSAQVEKG